MTPVLHPHRGCWRSAAWRRRLPLTLRGEAPTRPGEGAPPRTSPVSHKEEEEEEEEQQQEGLFKANALN